jgi:methionyl-tRNA formyltransferase
MMKIAILTSKNSWFMPYAIKMLGTFEGKGYSCTLFQDHQKISSTFQVVFILSYFKIIEKQFLKKHKHNLVVHESALPKGKGWAPLFWQILEGENKTPVVLLEASEFADGGDIYLKDTILLKGNELYDEIREKQAKKTEELCLKYLQEYDTLKPVPQKGKSTYYRKRNSLDSRLNINATIKEQYNLLRIASNNEFPAFFIFRGTKYILKIHRENSFNADIKKNV